MSYHKSGFFHFLNFILWHLTRYWPSKLRIEVMYCINIYILKRKTVPNSNGKIVEIYKIDTLYTNIYNSSLSLLGTSTLINSGGIKLVFLLVYEELRVSISSCLLNCHCHDRHINQRRYFWKSAYVITEEGIDVHRPSMCLFSSRSTFVHAS